MAQAVANATKEQKLGGETIVRAMEGISHIAAENLELSKKMTETSSETLIPDGKSTIYYKQFQDTL